MCRVTRVPAIGSQLVLAQTQSMSKNGSRARSFGLFGSRSNLTIGRQRMRLEPQLPSFGHWVNSHLQPPYRFVAAAMNLTMMPTAQWHREFVADLAAECGALREAHMVGVRWLPAADQARLFGNETDVIAVADPARLRKGEHALVNFFGAPTSEQGVVDYPGRAASAAVAVLMAWPNVAWLLAHRQHGAHTASRAANAASTFCASAGASLFFSEQTPVRPCCSVIA